MVRYPFQDTDDRAPKLLSLLSFETPRKPFSGNMIKTRLSPENPDANLKSYYQVYRGFSWKMANDLFPTYVTNQSNIISESVDRWAADEKTKNKTALIFEYAGELQRLTYEELRQESSRMANLLIQKGFSRGDTLIICSKPCPEFCYAVIACARLGVKFCALGARFSIDRLKMAISLLRPRGVLLHSDVSPETLNKDQLNVDTVFIAGNSSDEVEGWQCRLGETLQSMEPSFENVKLPIDEPLYNCLEWDPSGELQYITHAHKDMLGAYVTGKYVLDLRSDSVLWTDADPGCVPMVIYGIFAPLLCGCTTVVQGDTFSASTWYWTLERLGVSVWFTDSLKLKRLKGEGDDLLKGYDFSRLKNIATVGEPLTSELFQWVREKFRKSPHEMWMMDETGMICLANFPSEQIKVGSIGKPVPGVEASILDENGNTLPGFTLGQLSLRPNFPCLAIEMGPENIYSKGRIRDGWFFTGDLALKDDDGYYYYFGRVDHLIKIGQFLTGAPEIEQALLDHVDVDEAGVISKKCLGVGPFFKAFVKLKNSGSDCDEFVKELQEFVNKRLCVEIPTLEVEVLEEFPKVNSRGLLRRVLLAKELGLPVGDISRLKE
ncbi:MAG: AMP-binding protein [Pseudomonadota bacterium]